MNFQEALAKSASDRLGKQLEKVAVLMERGKTAEADEAMKGLFGLALVAEAAWRAAGGEHT